MFKKKYGKKGVKRVFAASAASKSRKVKVYDRSQPSIGTGVYGNNTPHYFKRQLDDAVLYTSAANTISAVTAVGAAPPWIAFSGVSADQGGVAAQMQFGFSISVNLGQVVNSAEFTNLFQQYQLLGIKCEFTPVMGDSNANIGAQLPAIYIAEDFNDAVPANNFAQAQQNDSLKMHILNNEFRVVKYVRPAPAVGLFQSAINTGYGAPSKDMWLDTTGVSASIPHYSYKCYVRNWFAAAANGGMGMRITPTLYMRFRGTH